MSSSEPTPFNARSALLSTLLGTEPPRLPVGRLVRAVSLFGITEGTARTALSRMVGRGEVERDDDGWYALTGALLLRQRRQSASRRAEKIEWNGRWRQAVVHPDARSAAERATLRSSMELLRFAEQREGVWTRPDNLPADRIPEAWAAPDEQCGWSSTYPDQDGGELVAELWDVDEWSKRADRLRREMAAHRGVIDERDPAGLGPGFVVSAAVLRHFQADPLLPSDLLPRRWPGTRLRTDYDDFDRAVRVFLVEWLAGGSSDRSAGS
jgi:phenylacetic acid degradation operon negative regulatory protein